MFFSTSAEQELLPDNFESLPLQHGTNIHQMNTPRWGKSASHNSSSNNPTSPHTGNNATNYKNPLAPETILPDSEEDPESPPPSINYTNFERTVFFAPLFAFTQQSSPPPSCGFEAHSSLAPPAST